MLGTTLPTPLYVIYQAQWQFSAVIVTVTFAVYAVAVLATLLLAGRSSDQAGRKPVLAAALAASALSTIVFILAPNVGVLIVGRILSGISAGLMTGTATAALTELVPASASRRASLVATAANMGGLGLGPLIAGLFAQYAPHHDSGVRGIPGRASSGGPVPVPRPRDSAPGPAAGLALRGPGDSGAGP
jgi:MFS family permease